MNNTSQKNIRQKDIEFLAKNEIFDQFQNQTILITGATGLIGSELILSIFYANKLRDLKIKVIALVRSIKKAHEIFDHLLKNKNLKIIQQDINMPIKLEDQVDYCIHAASITSSLEFIKYPVNTMMTIINGTNNILDFCVKSCVKSVIFLSSMEVYGLQNEKKMITEDDFSNIDILCTRSSYSQGKRAAETLCISYCNQYNLDVKIARLTAVFGPGFSINDNRVLTQFVKLAAQKQNITIFTEGKSLKNYCYITDAISAILILLKKGQSGQAYNVANNDTCLSLKELAGIVAKKYGLSVNFQIDNKNRGYLPDYMCCLDSQKLEKLGWRPVFTIDQIIENSFQWAKYILRL